MKYVICKTFESTPVNDFAAEEGWVYAVIEDDGGNVITVHEEIVGNNKFKALRSDFCEITKEEYDLIFNCEDGTCNVFELTESWIKRNIPLTTEIKEKV